MERMQHLPDTAMYREAVSKLRKLLYDPSPYISSNSHRHLDYHDSSSYGGGRRRASFRLDRGRDGDLDLNASSTRFHVAAEEEDLDSHYHARWPGAGSRPPSGFNSHRAQKRAETTTSREGRGRSNEDLRRNSSGGVTDRIADDQGGSKQRQGRTTLEDGGRVGGRERSGELRPEGGGGGRGGGDLSDDVVSTAALATPQGLSFGLLELVRRQDDLITQLEKENNFLRSEVLSIISSVQEITKENEDLRETISDVLKDSRVGKPSKNPDDAAAPGDQAEEGEEDIGEDSVINDGAEASEVTKVSELKKAKEKLENALKSQEQRLEELKQKEAEALEKLRTALDLAETTQRYSEKVREGAEKARAELATELQKAQTELQELRSQLKEAQEEGDRRQEVHDKLIEQRDKRAKRLEEEREELNDRIDALNQQLREKQNKVRDLEDDVREAMKKHMRLEEDLKILKQHEADAEDRHKHMLKMRDDEVQSQAARLSTLEALLTTARQDNAKLLATVTTLAQGRDDGRGDQKDDVAEAASSALTDALTALQATHEAEVASFRDAAENQKKAMESLRQEIAALRDRSSQEAEKHRTCLKKVEGGVHSLKEALEDATSTSKKDQEPLLEEDEEDEDDEEEEEEEEEEEAVEEEEEKEKKTGDDDDEDGDDGEDKKGEDESTGREGEEKEQRKEEEEEKEGEDEEEEERNNAKDKTQGGGGGGKEENDEEGNRENERPPLLPPGPDSSSPPSTTKTHDLPTDIESGVEFDLSERVDDDDDGSSRAKGEFEPLPENTKGNEDVERTQGNGDDSARCESCESWSLLVSALGQELDVIQRDLDKQAARIDRTMGRASSECPNCVKHIVLWMAASLRLDSIEETSESLGDRMDMLMHRLKMEDAVNMHPLLLATS